MSVLMELPVFLVLVLFLRVELQNLTVFVAFGDNELYKVETMPQQRTCVMRFWVLPFPSQGLSAT